MNDSTKHIVIIGGGISGLAAAYELGKRAEQQQKKINVLLLNKQAKFGGNATTVAFSLGNQRHYLGKLIRWADLGVNDINLDTYKNIERVMEDIEFIPKKSKPAENLKPLEDTACYFTLDGSIALTDDGDLKFGVSDPKYCIQNLEDGYYEDIRKAINKAALFKLYGKEDPDPVKDALVDLNTTLSDFFSAIIKEPNKELGGFSEGEEWLEAPAERIKRLITELRDYVFYPRISAMYFANDMGAENMLLAAPFQYYLRQESVDSEPDRRYFNFGTDKWIEALKRFIKENLKNDYFEVDFLPLEAQVTVHDKHFVIKGETKTFDYCVMATQADDALGVLSFEYDQNLSMHDQSELRHCEIDCRRILSKISYTSSIAVCHTYAGLLPPNRNLWRTYNVLIRKGAALKPYSMTYVCNRHQNDAEPGGLYNYTNMPQFFVTLNPQIPIPDKYILRLEDPEHLPEKLIASLPTSTMNLLKGLNFSTSPEDDELKAVATFRHNLINKACFEAQKELISFHEKTNQRLFFSGGWSHGSGLHEECWEQGVKIANLILPGEGG